MGKEERKSKLVISSKEQISPADVQALGVLRQWMEAFVGLGNLRSGKTAFSSLKKLGWEVHRRAEELKVGEGVVLFPNHSLASTSGEAIFWPAAQLMRVEEIEQPERGSVKVRFSPLSQAWTFSPLPVEGTRREQVAEVIGQYEAGNLGAVPRENLSTMQYGSFDGIVVIPSE